MRNSAGKMAGFHAKAQRVQRHKENTTPAGFASLRLGEVNLPLTIALR